MNIWIVVQLMFNLIFIAGILFLLINRKQTEKDDSKFSKGLQILQNKISVLEDLSDQTDEQVRSLTQLLEAKYREIQGLLVESDQQISKMEEIASNIWQQVESSSSVMGNQTSTEVQSMNKYVKAAQMAHSGKSIEEIIREIDITRGEAELIVAMNKDQLTFNQNTLPLWVQPDKAMAPQASTIGAEFLKALKVGPASENLSGLKSHNGGSNLHENMTSTLNSTVNSNMNSNMNFYANPNLNPSTNPQNQLTKNTNLYSNQNQNQNQNSSLANRGYSPNGSQMASEKTSTPPPSKQAIPTKVAPKVKLFEFRKIDLS
jgi:uncharacterized protein YoxC